MSTLYATDLDGTLLNEEAALSARTAAMCRRLADAGVMLTFITARTPATVESILAPACPQLPGVVMTGAAIWDAAARRYLSVRRHSERDALAIVSLCRTRGVAPFVYTLAPDSQQLVVYRAPQPITALEQHFVDDRVQSSLKRFELGRDLPPQCAGSVVLFFAMGEPAAIRDAANAISLVTGCYASCYPDTYNPGVALLEVFAPGVSKAQGLMNLKQLSGADRVVAFGDNLNDMPMLAAADVGVAMDNAHPQVKAMADVVIGPNTADAVVEYIAKMEGVPMIEG